MIVLIILILVVLLAVLGSRGKHTQPARTDKQRQADELITTILPTINNDK